MGGIIMKNIELILISIIIIFGCKNSPLILKESWMDKPVSSWPDFALTNEIGFTDTTYYDIANSFLVDTGFDTMGVSCKHLFLVFQYQLGLNSIDPGDKLLYWKMYPKHHKEKAVFVKRLINKDSNEPIDKYNTLKDRDWIIFELEEKNTQLYPLKIRYTPVRKNEIVYAVGWAKNQEDNSMPGLFKMQCYMNSGNYFYVIPIENQLYGRSGSPVIDENGYLVGIVSGQEGKLGVMGAVTYLTKLFDKYGFKYNNHIQ